MVLVFWLACGIGATIGGSSHSMPTSHEVDRLTKVYAGYRDSDTIQGQWDGHNLGNQAILSERQRGIERVLARHGLLPLRGRHILDVGCGVGHVLADLKAWGASSSQLVGIDLLPDRIAAAQRNYPELQFQLTNAEQLDFPDEAFDIVLTFTVFSSILDPQMAQNVAQEIVRVLRPRGFLLWYDFRFNNPRNPHVQGMTRRRIRQLFSELTPDLFSITVLPPLARRLGRFTPLFYPLMSQIPFLRTHYLGVLQKK